MREEEMSEVSYEYRNHLKKYCHLHLPKRNIKNKSKLISKQEIHEVVSILNQRYQEFDLPIFIHGSRFGILLHALRTKEKNSKQALFMGMREKIGGYQSPKEIVIFSNTYKNEAKEYVQKTQKGIFKLFVVETIFHELRHVYQMRHMKRKYDKASEDYRETNEEGYHSQWIERDACGFAQRMMNNNKKEINRILDISFEWDCTWGNFTINT